MASNPKADDVHVLLHARCDVAGSHPGPVVQCGTFSDIFHLSFNYFADWPGPLPLGWRRIGTASI